MNVERVGPVVPIQGAEANGWPVWDNAVAGHPHFAEKYHSSDPFELIHVRGPGEAEIIMPTAVFWTLYRRDD